MEQDSASESAAQTETDAPTAEVNGMHLVDNKASPDATTPPSSSPSAASHVPDDGASESAAPDNMDSIVEGLLIAGLHTVDDDDLPMQTNEFYSKAALGCKPAGTQNQPFSGSLQHFNRPDVACSVDRSVSASFHRLASRLHDSWCCRPCCGHQEEYIQEPSKAAQSL